MKRLLSAIAGLLFFFTRPALSQANGTCQVRPATLAAMRNCYRPLLVFSPRANDPQLKTQSDSLDAAADDMMDRFVLLTPIVADSKGYQPPLDAPYAILNVKEAKVIRQHYHVSEEIFLVLLLGEDGSIKMRSTEPVDPARLNALIDTMPTRRVERERPHAN